VVPHTHPSVMSIDQRVFGISSIVTRWIVALPFALQSLYFFFYMSTVRFSYSYAVNLATRLIIYHSVIWVVYSLYHVLLLRRMHVAYALAFHAGLLLIVPFEVRALHRLASAIPVFVVV